MGMNQQGARWVFMPLEKESLAIIGAGATVGMEGLRCRQHGGGERPQQILLASTYLQARKATSALSLRLEHYVRIISAKVQLKWTTNQIPLRTTQPTHPHPRQQVTNSPRTPHVWPREPSSNCHPVAVLSPDGLHRCQAGQHLPKVPVQCICNCLSVTNFIV